MGKMSIQCHAVLRRSGQITLVGMLIGAFVTDGYMYEAHRERTVSPWTISPWKLLPRHFPWTLSPGFE